MQGLEGKVAVVTGAASGIGRATAHKLAASGAAVVIADINEAGAADCADSIKSAGGSAAYRVTDVAEETSIQSAIEYAVATFGSLQLLHNNAADIAVLEHDLDLINMDAATWDRTMLVNLRGPMLGCKYAIPHMIAAGGGAIVNTSSTAGQAGFLNFPAYGSSKAGLDSLTRYVATLYGKQGVRCNSVALSAVDTPGLRQVVPEAIIRQWELNHLTTKLGAPADLADVVAFLLSDAAAFVTGQTVNADGGLMAHYPLYAALIEGLAQ